MNERTQGREAWDALQNTPAYVERWQNGTALTADVIVTEKTNAQAYELGDLVLYRGAQAMITGIDLLPAGGISYKVIGAWVTALELTKIVAER